MDENYENDWIKKYNKEKVNNDNVSPPPYIVETGNFV
jgi:hypothetical protein